MSLELSGKNEIINGISVDVEEYFQVSNFENTIPFKLWRHCESRVEKSTLRILDLFDERSIHATFFILGWIAERVPDLVREIARRGHEVASHGYRHQLVYTLSEDEFRSDLKKAKDILEKITSTEVIGYRAPSYSITRKNFNALSLLHECGFQYDSSIFPIYHHRYGIPDFSRFPVTIELDNERVIREFPIATVRLFSKNIPVGGGAYARLLPLGVLKAGLSRINTKERQPFIFYFHPWEIDPDQPRIPCNILTRIRHYGNLSGMESKLRKLLSIFKFAPLKEL